MQGHRLGAGMLIGVIVWWAVSGIAAAHTGLAGSTPEDGAVVTEPLTEITFTFTQAIEPFEDGFALVVFDGSMLPIAAIEQPDPSTIVVVPVQPIEIPVEARWAIVSGDSHPVTGSILVIVDLPPPATTSTTTTSTTTPTSATTTPATTTVAIAGAVGDGSTDGPPPSAPGIDEQIEILRERVAGDEGSGGADAVAAAIRWLTYASTALVLGGTTLALVAGARGIPLWPSLTGWLWAALLVLIGSTALTVGAQLAELTGDAADVLSIGSWGDVFEGRFRTGVLVRLAGAALLAAALPMKERGRATVFAAGAGAILASYPLLGHGDGAGWMATPATMVHVAAISVWVGGLGAVLVVHLRRTGADAATVTRLFSGVAAVALAATVIAGAALTLAQLDAPSELWSSDYGRRLLLKIVLVAAVAAIGALHRFRTVPALEMRADGSVTAFVRLAALEVAGFAAVLAATAWLVIGSG